jgi:transcriptional regulator with XRE-family HTH domain
MPKTRFGDLLQHGRTQKGLSLRELSAQSGIEFSRLSRMEHGTRPAPSLPHLRRLADLLSLDLVDLLVSAGTPREVVEQLLWAERLQEAKRKDDLAEFAPQAQLAGLKNEHVVDVTKRDGSTCRVRLGTETWTVMTFSGAKRLTLRVPPQSIHVYADDPSQMLLSDCNVFAARIAKTRIVGALLHLVLEIGGIELNALLKKAKTQDETLDPGRWIYAVISPAALATEPIKEPKGKT